MSFFVDYAAVNLNKFGEELCGDTVEFFRSKDSSIAVLSDGLGSGVKANILSTLTAKIAITMLKEGLPIEEVVDTIIHTLPVCQVRKLAYSTFTIVKIDDKGMAYVVEFDNPNLFFIHDNKIQNLESSVTNINGRKIKESTFQIVEGDTLVFVSDGAIHAGVGNLMNLGWGWSEVADFIERMPHYAMSSKEIANKLLDACDALYIGEPGDDTTVVALKLIRPKKVTLFSGPPKDYTKDKEIIRDLMEGTGQKIVCGGTASNIVSRELQENMEIDMEYVDKNIPPIAHIKGINLVTEGVLTIRATIEMLNKIKNSTDLNFLYEKNGAAKLARILFEDCTHLQMLIGRAINPAHQNPDFPEELSIKYKLLMDLQRTLENLGKVVEVKYY